jgi:hypothetical protein
MPRKTPSSSRAKSDHFLLSSQKEKNILTRLSEQEKKALDDLVLASGKTLQDYVKDAIFHKRQLDQPHIENKSNGSSTSQEQEQQLAASYDCLWEYKEARSYQGGNWEFEIAICRPKTADNDLTILEVLKYACPRCKVFLANRTVAERAAKGKATRIVDMNADDQPGYLAREGAMLVGRLFKCEAPNCDFQTSDQREAAKHQERGFEHWFSS